jgi:hypothetical protein
VVHCPVCWSQASPVGQSVVEPQPHFPPLSQTLPFGDVVQSLHVEPVGPQAFGALPCTHVPRLEQQPTLHPVVPLPHEVEQVCAVVLQA